MYSRALVVLILASTTYASPKFYQRATVVHMGTVKCIAMQSESHGVVGVLFGPTNAAQTERRYCSEYVLESDKVVYRVRPKRGDQLLMPVGEEVQFRFQRNEMFVRPDDNDREYEFSVTSMTLRSAQKEMELSEE